MQEQKEPRMSKSRRAAIYLRVGTTGQTTENRGDEISKFESKDVSTRTMGIFGMN